MNKLGQIAILLALTCAGAPAAADQITDLIKSYGFEYRKAFKIGAQFYQLYFEGDADRMSSLEPACAVRGGPQGRI